MLGGFLILALAISVRFLAQRTGVDMGDQTPQQLSEEIFKCSQENLRSMRAGAYFVLADDYAGTSDVFKQLTETCIAIPRENFFCRDMSCLQDGGATLPESLRNFVNEERLSEAYKTGRKEFASTLKLGMLSMLQNLLIIGSAAKDGFATATVALKNVAGKVLGVI